MSDYKSKEAFDENVMPHNKPANFTNLSNRSRSVDKKSANGSKPAFPNTNKGNTDTGKINSAIKSDAPAGSNGGAFKGFIGGK